MARCCWHTIRFSRSLTGFSLLNGSKVVQGTKSMNSDKLDGMQMCRKKKLVRLHITAVKRHVSPIELEETYDSDEKDGENFDDLRAGTA